MATMIRRTDRHEQLSFRAQVRRLATSRRHALKKCPSLLNLELGHYNLLVLAANLPVGGKVVATVGYLVHQENVLSQAIDNVKDLRDALALERRANDGEVSKSTRDFWQVLLTHAASLHGELGQLLEQARTEFGLEE